MGHRPHQNLLPAPRIRVLLETFQLPDSVSTIDLPRIQPPDFHLSASTLLPSTLSLPAIVNCSSQLLEPYLVFRPLLPLMQLGSVSFPSLLGLLLYYQNSINLCLWLSGLSISTPLESAYLSILRPLLSAFASALASWVPHSSFGIPCCSSTVPSPSSAFELTFRSPVLSPSDYSRLFF